MMSNYKNHTLKEKEKKLLLNNDSLFDVKSIIKLLESMQKFVEANQLKQKMNDINTKMADIIKSRNKLRERLR